MSELAASARSPSAEESQREVAPMKKLIIPTLALTVVQNTAFAAPGTATGPTALALPALLAQHSPPLRTFDKRLIARPFPGNTSFGFTPTPKIPLDAHSLLSRPTNPHTPPP